MLSLFDFPDVYEAILGRPQAIVDGEVETILALLAKHHIGEGSLLELACGTCPHGISLARAGFQVVGIDRSRAMLGEARDRVARENVGIDLVKADVLDFALDRTDFDAAIFMYETFPLITEFDQIQDHFNAVRRHVRKGGIYIVDVDVPKGGIRQEMGAWGRKTIKLPDGHVETWYEDLPGNWMQGTNHVILHCLINLEDDVHMTRDEWIVRSYNMWDWKLLIKITEDWKLDGFYSWRGLSQDISGDDHYFVVLIAC